MKGDGEVNTDARERTREYLEAIKSRKSSRADGGCGPAGMERCINPLILPQLSLNVQA